MPETLDIDQLNRRYEKADSAHKALFAEQRSNVQLVAGNHYTRRGSEFWRKVRNNPGINKTQRVRVTKNHIQKITKGYINSITSHAPGVTIVPKNKSEFSDQKDAQLNNSVWFDIRKRHNFDKLTRSLVKDFVEIGEAWLKVFFDPKKGQFLGFETDDDEDGKPKRGKDGDFIVLRRFTGDVVYERVHGFNVLTDPEARSYEEVRWLCYRKMVNTKELKEQFKDDEDKQKKIQESADQTWMLFDGSRGHYRSSKNSTMVREYYFKPNYKWPNGYYYITTADVILYEGELPEGVFPICHVGFDDASTTARSFSVIKQLRPYQAEVNRVSSKIIEHSVTLGDDKIVTQAGSNLTPGGTYHGIKEIKSTGPVTHLPGRNGEQFLGYMQQQIDEMYFVAGINENMEEKQDANIDPYTLLFRSLKDKKKFSLYSDKVESFLREICDKSLRLARANYDDDMIIQVLDKKERVNIPEFRASDDLAFDIVIEPRSEDIESQMGKQVALNHFVQFAGQQMDKETLGKVMKAMPLLNEVRSFDDLTIDDDNVLSDIVAMDRGEFVSASIDDNHPYYIRRLTHRMKMKDFQFLAPEIQRNYEIKRDQHNQFEAQKAQAAAAANSGFIPSGGFSVTCDIRVPRADDPTRTERAKVPVEALDWLIKKLDEQGTTQEVLQSLPQSSLTDIGTLMAGQPAGGPEASLPPDPGAAPLPNQVAG